MIRINLLPRAERQTAAGGSNQLWSVVYVVGALLWCGLLLIIYLMSNNQLEELEARNQDLTTKIDDLKQQSADLESVKTKVEKSKRLEAVVRDLEKAQLGPTNIMLELARVLSVGGRPTVDPERLAKLREDNPLAGFSPNWDPRRLWLKSFEEEGRECHIRGEGKSNEDIAEFLRRLAISEYFEEVTLQKSELTAGEAGESRMIGFDVTCKVRY
ncbi:MAG: PilN domain-containing protein [Myxococcales bacterium]|nr:PilN domain-containing protein [Myxococcales bacterium]MCB9708738.1 PilN domain-containing protein [Myxococcales bacterium]